MKININPGIFKWGFNIYLLLVILLVTLPLNSAGELNDIFVLKIRSDYFFHALMFLPWVFFQPASKMNLLPWLIIGLLFASASEAIQYILPYRAFNINDLLANNVGIILGLLLSIIIKINPK